MGFDTHKFKLFTIIAVTGVTNFTGWAVWLQIKLLGFPRVFPDMTLAVERDIRPRLWPLSFQFCGYGFKFSEMEQHLTPDLQRETTLLKESIPPGMKTSRNDRELCVLEVQFLNWVLYHQPYHPWGVRHHRQTQPRQGCDISNWKGIEWFITSSWVTMPSLGGCIVFYNCLSIWKLSHVNRRSICLI